MITKITRWYFSRNALPYWCILALDCFIIVFAGLVSVYLLSGGDAVAHGFWQYVTALCCLLPFFILGMRLFHTYSGILRYSSFVDLMRIACALLVGVVCSFLLSEALSLTSFSFQLPPISLTYQIVMFMMAMVMMWSVRILAKYLFDTGYKSRDAKRVFIFGIKDGGISLAKSMRNEHPIRYLVKGFVTDDPSYKGRYLVGVNVYYADSKLIDAMREVGATRLFVSPLASERFRNNQTLIDELMKAGIKIMMMPSEEHWDGKTTLKHGQLKKVDIEDLLPRDKIDVDLDAIGKMLQGKRILITGAAGSIGSEMVRQVAKFAPEHLILIDQAETPMHDVRLYMSRNYPQIPCETIVSSISNATHMEQIFSQYKPEYVFHAAAYKHVPMMEDNPAMAIQNNVYGTRVIADLAVKYEAKKFVMISTDKAVNPTNVMGCSKRICEIYCQALNNKLWEETQRTGKPTTQFITTRFGNVLGSNGSVIPIFKEQIRKGGPVTVTHPDIIRFFMLIPEACQLVLEAGTMGHGGEIFVFDMGKPVRIYDLAENMIRLSKAENVKIKEIGLRPGEKLYEELLSDKENTLPTKYPKILHAKVEKYEESYVDQQLIDLWNVLATGDAFKIVSKLKEIIPEYVSNNSKFSVLDKE